MYVGYNVRFINTNKKNIKPISNFELHIRLNSDIANTKVIMGNICGNRS